MNIGNITNVIRQLRSQGKSAAEINKILRENNFFQNTNSKGLTKNSASNQSMAKTRSSQYETLENNQYILNAYNNELDNILQNNDFDYEPEPENYVQTENSVFTDENVQLGSQNKSSITFDNTSSYIAEYRYPNRSSYYTGSMQSGMTTDKLISQQYDTDSENLMTEGQKNAAAWAFFDNNREHMISSVNLEYLNDQIAEDLGSMTKADQSSVKKCISEIAKAYSNGRDVSFNKIEGYSELPQTIKDGLEVVNNKYINKEYKQFDENIKAEDIPPQYIRNATIPQKNSEGKYANLFLANLSNITENENYVTNRAANIESSVQYVPNKESSDININDVPESQRLKAIETAICEAYGIDSLKNKNGLYTNEAVAILHAMGLEDANNKIFEGKNENINNYLQLILNSADKNGNIHMAFPEVNASIMTNRNMTNDEVQAFMKKSGNTNISYVNVTQDSFDLSKIEASNKEFVSGADFLQFVSWGEGNMQEALNNIKNKNSYEYKSLATLANSALQQLIENNPKLNEIYQKQTYDTLLERNKELIDNLIEEKPELKEELEKYSSINELSKNNPDLYKQLEAKDTFANELINYNFSNLINSYLEGILEDHPELKEAYDKLDKSGDKNDFSQLIKLINESPDVDDSQKLPEKFALENIAYIEGHGGAAPRPAPRPIPEPEPDPEPIPDPGPDPEPIPDPGPDPEPIPDPGPDPEPIPDPGPDPEPIPDPGPEHDYYDPDTEDDELVFSEVIQTTTQTSDPTKSPDDDSIKSPDDDSTKSPTSDPTKSPTSDPTKSPDDDSIKSPDDDSTKSPTSDPTKSPDDDSIKSPDDDSTKSPTSDPTKSPADDHTKSPADDPTKSPADDPTKSPSTTPIKTQETTSEHISGPNHDYYDPDIEDDELGF